MADALNDPLPDTTCPKDKIVGFNGEHYDEKEYELTDQMCCWCRVPVPFVDAQAGSIATWVDESKFLCTDCMKK